MKTNKRKGNKPKVQKKSDFDLIEVSSKAQQLKTSIVDLKIDQQQEVANWIGLRIQQAIDSDEWQKVYANIRTYRDFYENGVPRSEIGMKGAHDYRSLLSSSATDGLRSRLIGVFAIDPIIRLEGRNKEGIKNQPTAERFIDYHHDVNLKLPVQGETLVSYLTIEGHAVMYCPYRLEIENEAVKQITKKVYVLGNQRLLVNVNDKLEIANAETAGFVPKEPEEFEVEEVIGPEIVKNYPDLEVRSLLDYICPAGSSPNKRPLWEAIRQNFILDELLKLEEEGQIYAGSLERIRKYLKNLPDDVAPQKSNQSSVPAVEEVEGEQPFEKDSQDAGISCWMVWGKIKIPGQKYLTKVSLIYHPESKTVLQVKYNSLIGSPVPIFHTRLVKIPQRFAGIGCMEMVQPSERTINDLVNYVLDETRIFSSIPYKRKERVAPLSPFEFWKGFAVKNMSDIEFPNIPDRRPVDLNIATYIRSNMERRSGIGDLQLGRESDISGKQPPTARGVISVLREGQVRFGLLNFSFINVLCEWASYEMLMFQQLIGKKTVIDAVGEDGKELFPDGLSRTEIMGAFKFVPNTNAQNLIRELDLEVNMMLYDKLIQNKLVDADISAFYELTNNLWNSTGKKKQLLKPLSVYRKVMNLPDPEDQLLDMNPQEQQFAQALIQAGVPEQVVKQKIEELRKSAEGGTTGENLSPEDLATMLDVSQGKIVKEEGE